MANVGFFRTFNLMGKISSCNLQMNAPETTEKHGEQQLKFLEFFIFNYSYNTFKPFGFLACNFQKTLNL